MVKGNFTFRKIMWLYCNDYHIKSILQQSLLCKYTACLMSVGCRFVLVLHTSSNSVQNWGPLLHPKLWNPLIVAVVCQKLHHFVRRAVSLAPSRQKSRVEPFFSQGSTQIIVWLVRSMQAFVHSEKCSNNRHGNFASRSWLLCIQTTQIVLMSSCSRHFIHSFMTLPGTYKDG